MKKTLDCYLVYKTTVNEYDVWTWKPHSDEYLLVSRKEVEFDVPDDFDPRPLQIKALKQKQKEAAAAFHALSTEIMRQIQELQALEMTA